MAVGYVALPQYRAPEPLDFSSLSSAFDDLAKSRERNRLLEESKQIGAALQGQGQAPQSYTAQPTNRLMQPSPAQSSFAAAGREYPATARSPYSNAISSIESGGRYDEVGPVTRTGDRAYGKYQVMGENVGPWTREILGRELTPQQFLADQDAQEKVFSGKFGQYVQKTGNPQDAASMWFTGRPQAQGANRRDMLGTTGAEYVRRFDAAMGQGGQPMSAPAAAPRPTGMNYDAGIAAALRQGNVGLATQLQQAKQEAENLTYTRGRQATQDAQAAESHALTTQGQRETLQKNFTSRVGAIAQTIQSEPDPAKKQAMWQRFIAADPRFTQALRAYGVDPSDVEAGARTLIAEALGVTGGEESGTTPQYYVDPADGKTKIGVITKQGKFRAVTTPGQVLPPVKPVDTGTGTTFVGPGAAPVGAPIPKDVAGKERQEAVGKGEGERQLAQPATQASVRNSLSGLDRLVQEARELRGMPGVAAMTGSIQGSGWVPTIRQDTANAEAKLETLKSQIAFNVLQAMRDASKTGGALGSIAVEELRMLQNNLASLDTRQGEQAFKDSLDRIMDYADGAKVRLLQGYKGTYGQEFDANAAPPPQNPPAPEADAVRVNSVEEAMALRPGTRFITPDGRTKVRP